MDNNNSGTNKQSIIGFVLIGLVFFGYMLYNNYQMQKYNEQLATEQVEQLAEAASNALEPATESATPAAVETEAEPVVDAAQVQTLNVENDVLSLQFSTLGAQIVDATLKDYTKYAPKNERHELVKLFDPESAKLNLSFYVKQQSRNVLVNTAERNFELLPVEVVEGAQVVTMRLPFGEGASLDYVYTLYDNKAPERDYMVDFEVRMNNLAPLMSNQSSIGVEWGNRSYQNERSFKNENMYTTIAYRLPHEKDIEELGMSEKSQSEEVSSSVEWVAFKQQYFTSALIARSTDFTYADMEYNTVGAKTGYIKDFAMQGAVAYTPQTTSYDFSFYLGPNKFSVLKKLKDESGESLEMERVIPLGWIFSTWISRWIVIPIFDFLQKYIASFGLIILILTIIVKLLIFPLTYKSYLSMAKTRVLRPEMEEINAKYPRQEDAMKKQQATMELYQKAGINPMSGCLPMLIQMPILIAMFRFFPASIELRGKSFLWSDDLSSYDSILDLPFDIPFYGDHVSLFCLLMTLVMFIYSYMNYKQTAASQPQMAGMQFMTVYMMPLMMLFWFNDYASGLCYYYLLTNLLTIIQTFAIRLLVNDDKVRAGLTKKMKNTKGKKSRFQQKYEELMKQQQELARQQQQGRR
ncbi:MAG: membrane protein insertase YidC [Alistipes sp.]|nr:membrane protein insertase YidC [Alistipes sp.]